MIENTKSKMKELFSSDKVKKIIIIAGFIGIALLFLSEVLPKNTQSKSGSDNTSSSSATEDNYEQTLTSKIADMVKAITGGTAQITVTLEKSSEYVYAYDEKNSGEDTTHIILKDKDGSQSLVKVTQIEPIVKGVVIVCKNGGDAVTKQRITDAVTTALGISSAHVCVLELKQ